MADNFRYQWNKICQTLLSNRSWDWIKKRASDRSVYTEIVNCFLRSRFKLYVNQDYRSSRSWLTKMRLKIIPDLLDFDGQKITKLFHKEHTLDRFVCFYIMIGLYRLIMGF